MEQIRGNGEHILIVEDETMLRNMVADMLRALGYSTSAVASGEDAVFYLENNEVQLIMFDMVLGLGINGREAYERILAFKPRQRAIIVSGFVDSIEITRMLQLGASQLVKKPFTVEDLGLAIKKALSG